MNTEDVNKIVTDKIEDSQAVLIKKAGEYADKDNDDRLHSFRRAAALRGQSMREALGGMMLKHTVSVYDMIDHPHTDYPQDVWDEKIGDHLNYLLLLAAVVEDEKRNKFTEPLADLEKPLLEQKTITFNGRVYLQFDTMKEASSYFGSDIKFDVQPIHWLSPTQSFFIGTTHYHKEPR